MSFSDLEHQLRAEGDRWRSQFPAADTFAQSLAAAQQARSHRVWLAPLAAAAVIVTLVAGTVLVARPGHHSIPAAGPVPWSSAVVPVPPPTALPVSANSAYRGCTDPGDFRLGQVGAGPGLYGQFSHPVRLRMALQYRGKAPCHVYPYSIGLQLLDEAGRVLPTTLEISTGVAHPGPEAQYDVRPGDTVIVSADWEDSCTTSTAVQFRAWVAGKPGVSTALPGGSRPPCPVAQVAQPHFLHALAAVVVPPGSVAGLVASIHAPATARYGHPLNFTVTITNFSDKPVRLEPCPTYKISLSGDLPVSVTRGSYQVGHTLNCARGPAELNPGAAMDWAMRIDVPLNPRPLEALGWQFIRAAAASGDGRDSLTPITVS